MYKPRVCYDLRKKEYTLKYANYLFSFSSKEVLGRFLEATECYSKGDIHTVEKFFERYNVSIDLSLLKLIKTYMEIQRRGFYVEHSSGKVYTEPKFKIDVEW